MNKGDLQRLKDLSDLMLDRQIDLLRKAAQAKAQTESALADLARPMPVADDLLGASAALAHLTYQRWADARRAEINQVLARQTHDWMEARDEARMAFGKAEALRRLSQKHHSGGKG